MLQCNAGLRAVEEGSNSLHHTGRNRFTALATHEFRAFPPPLSSSPFVLFHNPVSSLLKVGIMPSIWSCLPGLYFIIISGQVFRNWKFIRFLRLILIQYLQIMEIILESMFSILLVHSLYGDLLLSLWISSVLVYRNFHGNCLMGHFACSHVAIIAACLYILAK